MRLCNQSARARAMSCWSGTGFKFCAHLASRQDKQRRQAFLPDSTLRLRSVQRRKAEREARQPGASLSDPATWRTTGKQPLLRRLPR